MPDIDAEALRGLIERLEAATGPDRELDIAIAGACFDLRRYTPEVEKSLGYQPGALEPEIIRPERVAGPQFEPIPHYTKCLAAITALVGRVLPDWGMQVGHPLREYHAEGWYASVFRERLAGEKGVLDGHFSQFAYDGLRTRYAPTGALALCLALLRALEARAG